MVLWAGWRLCGQVVDLQRKYFAVPSSKMPKKAGFPSAKKTSIRVGGGSDGESLGAQSKEARVDDATSASTDHRQCHNSCNLNYF